MSSLATTVAVHHHYDVECYRSHDRTTRQRFRDARGRFERRLVWRESFDNLVVTEGLNKYLDATLKTGLAAPAWYVGLIKAKTTGVDAADTLASHGGWTEAIPGTDYTGDRQAYMPGAISGGSVDNSASKAEFPILDSFTMQGAFMADAATGTSGTLLGGGDFAAPRSVEDGDTLTVAVTCSIAAS